MAKVDAARIETLACELISKALQGFIGYAGPGEIETALSCESEEVSFVIAKARELLPKRK